MGFIITFAIGLCINLFFSRVRLVDKSINKNIKTFRVNIGDTILNQKLGVSVTEIFKNSITETLKNDYKLKIFNVEDKENNPDLSLHYFIEEYSLNDINEKKDYKLVKFKFSLNFVVLKTRKTIEHRLIEFEMKKSESNELKNVIENIVKRHIDDFVDNYLIGD